MEEGIGWLGGEDIFANNHERDVCDTDVLFSDVSVDCTESLALRSRLTFWAPPNITAYLLTSTVRLRKLELMSATISRSFSDAVSS